MLVKGKSFFLLSLLFTYFVVARVNSVHNLAVTDKIVKDVIDDGDYKSKTSISCE